MSTIEVVITDHRRRSHTVLAPRGSTVYRLKSHLVFVHAFPATDTFRLSHNGVTLHDKDLVCDLTPHEKLHLDATPLVMQAQAQPSPPPLQKSKATSKACRELLQGCLTCRSLPTLPCQT